MSYNPVNWVNGETPINDTNLNNMDQGIAGAHSMLEEHEIKIDDFANEQIPEEYVKGAVDDYISENQAGLASKEVVEELAEEVDKLSGEIADVCDIALLGLINVNDNYDAYNITFANNGKIQENSKRCCVMYVDSETLIVPNDGYSFFIAMTHDSGTTPYDTEMEYFDGKSIVSQAVWLKEQAITPISDNQIVVIVKSNTDEELTTDFDEYVNFYRNEKYTNVLVRGGFRTSETYSPIKNLVYSAKTTIRTVNKIADNVSNITVADGYFLKIVNISKTGHDYNVPIQGVTNIDLKSFMKQDEYDIYLSVYKKDNSVITETNFNDIVTFGYDTKTIAQEKKSFTEIKYVAAYDSTELDKENADYVCDGVNDEIEIQQAIDSLTYGGTVYLMTGNYNIDGWNHIVTETLNGTTYNVAFAIGITDRNQQTIRIKGQTPPLRTYGGKKATGTAIINFTSTALSLLEEYSAGVGIGYIGIAGTNRLYPKFGLDIENIGFNLADNQHSLKVINAELFSEFYLRNYLICVDVTGDTDDTSGYQIPNDNCIGIRGLSGSNFGKGYRISDGFVFGMGIGYDLNGEHLIMEQCGVRYSKIPYRFGHNNKAGVNSHDLTLINCCHEGCIQGIEFGNSPHIQSINFYDYNMEILSSGNFAQTKKATEKNIGNGRGNIFYTVNSSGSSYVNYFDTFFEDGHGSNFNVVCTTAPRYGLSTDRPTVGNPMQKYYCTDTKKETMYIPTDGWVEI